MFSLSIEIEIAEFYKLSLEDKTVIIKQIQKKKLMKEEEIYKIFRY
jgi:hypothetical protein